MKYLQQLKISIKSVFIQGPMILLMYCGIPLILAFVFSFINGDFMNSLQEIPTIYVQIDDQDQSDISKEFYQLFNNKPFELVNDDTDYFIEIPEGFGDSIANAQTIKLDIMEQKDLTNIKQIVMESIIDNYNKLISESIYISSVDEILDKEAFIVQNALLDTQNNIEINYLENIKQNTAFDEALLMVVGFVFFTVLSSIGGAAYVQSEGMKQREHSLPTTKTGQLHREIFDGIILAVAVFICSTLVFSIFSAVIRTHLIYFIPIIIIESILASMLGIFVSQFLPKNIGTAIMTGVTVIDMLISSGSFSFFAFLSDYSPSKIIKELVSNGYIGNLNQIIFLGGISLSISIIIYIALRIKIKVKWGKQS